MSSRQWQWCRGLSEICKLMTLHANKDDRIQNKRIGDKWEKERSNGVMSLSKCEEMGSSAQAEVCHWIIQQKGKGRQKMWVWVQVGRYMWWQASMEVFFLIISNFLGKQEASQLPAKSECQERCAGGLRRENRCAVVIYRE